MDDTKVTQARGAFSLSCRVQTNIQARPETLWGLLTDAQGFPSWNSAVTAIDGQIDEGQKIKVHAPGTKRTFTPKVSGVKTNRRMMWIGGVPGLFKGLRTFELVPRDDGSTDFIMRERFSGLMMPLAKRSMPDFGPVFRQYADDLKRAGEQRAAERRAGEQRAAEQRAAEQRKADELAAERKIEEDAAAQRAAQERAAAQDDDEQAQAV
jgi:hypothetical protein